jgi:hypothetical protein
LRVSAAFPERLLAMKVLAAGRRDVDDIRFLVKHLNMATADDVLALCAEVFPDEGCPCGHDWFWKTPSTTIDETRRQGLIVPHPAPVT